MVQVRCRVEGCPSAMSAEGDKPFTYLCSQHPAPVHRAALGRTDTDDAVLDTSDWQLGDVFGDTRTAVEKVRDNFPGAQFRREERMYRKNSINPFGDNEVSESGLPRGYSRELRDLVAADSVGGFKQSLAPSRANIETRK